jgi:hypothetical protein
VLSETRSIGTLSHHPCNSALTSGQDDRKEFLLWKFRKCGNRPVVPLPFNSVGFSLRQRNATARFAMLATQRHIVLFAVAVSSVGARHAVPERATRAPEPATHCALWRHESRSPSPESKLRARVRQRLAHKLAYAETNNASFHPASSGPVLAALPDGSRRCAPHIVDGGHCALDTAADQIAMFIRDFMK